jgi:hypothetical protein
MMVSAEAGETKAKIEKAKGEVKGEVEEMKGETKAMQEELKGNDTKAELERAKGKVKGAGERAKGKMNELKEKAKGLVRSRPAGSSGRRAAGIVRVLSGYAACARSRSAPQSATRRPVAHDSRSRP